MALAAVVSATVAVAVAPALVPAGPRLAVLKQTSEPAGLELATLGPGGGGYQLLPFVHSAPRGGFEDIAGLAWSPDGATLAFSDRRHRDRAISIVSADGSSPQVVPGTRGGFLPVFSPDGRSLAFTRVLRRGPHRYRWGTRWGYESSSVWIVDLDTRISRQLTSWRNDLNHYAASFSPDGSTLLVTRWDIERSQDPELVALRFDGRPSGLLVNEGALPVYSPDGSKIALIREIEIRLKPLPHERDVPAEFRSYRSRTNTELYVINADGSHLRRLTHTPHKDELFASWDPSGKRIAYAQFRNDRLDLPNVVMQINANGTCPTKILAKRGATFYAPAWQPGPGREAGPISC